MNNSFRFAVESRFTDSFGERKIAGLIVLQGKSSRHLYKRVSILGNKIMPDKSEHGKSKPGKSRVYCNS